MSEKYEPASQDVVSDVDTNLIPTPDSLSVSHKVRREVNGDIFNAMSDLDIDGFGTKREVKRAD